jgi:hypothetical protein
MSDETVRQAVERAVGQAFDGWAAKHPALAGAIDRLTLTDLAATSLRDSDEYRQAVAAYHRGMSESDLAGRLLDIASGVLAGFMGG